MNEQTGLDPILQALRTKVDTSFEEVGALFGTLQGLWLINPWTDTFASAKAYMPFLATGIPEWLWGVGMVVLAYFKYRAAKSDNRVWRMRLSMVAAVQWGLFMFQFAIGNFAGIAVPAYIALFIVTLRSRSKMLDAWRRKGANL